LLFDPLFSNIIPPFDLRAGLDANSYLSVASNEQYKQPLQKLHKVLYAKLTKIRPDNVKLKDSFAEPDEVRF
jgi:hypothetical protein